MKDAHHACPFCGVRARGPMVADSSTRAPRASRSAIALGVSVGAAVSLALVDCSSSAYGGHYPGDVQVYPADAAQDAPHDADTVATSDADEDAGDASEDADASELDAPSDG